MTLHISETEVDRLLDMPTTIEAVEDVFRMQGEGRVHNVPRRRAVGESMSLHVMAAAISPLDRIGFQGVHNRAVRSAVRRKSLSREHW